MPNAKGPDGKEIEVATQQDDGTILMPDGSVVGQDGKPVQQSKQEQKELEDSIPSRQEMLGGSAGARTEGTPELQAETTRKKGR